jgi:hypothetical protein
MDVSFDPAYVGLLGAQAVMLRAQAGDNLVQQAGRRGGAARPFGLHRRGELIGHGFQLIRHDWFNIQPLERERQLIGQSDKLFTVVLDVDITLDSTRSPRRDDAHLREEPH